MITSLIRSNLRKFKPYSSARSLYQKGVFFDANENPFGSVVETPIASELNRYPDPYSLDLRNSIGTFLGVSAENILVGNGSNEAIDLLIRLFVEPDEEILTIEPTYGMYAVIAELVNVRINRFFLRDDFTLDIPALLKSVTPKTKVIFCCSPNSPTGTLVDATDIERLCKNFKGVVVVDEAYIEFSSEPSLVSKISEFQNLVILRTFSKAWGLAGIRVGYAIAAKETIGYLNRIKLPYNLNKLSSKLAMEALKQYPKMLERKALILEGREKLATALKKLGFTVFPSETNFLLARFPKASIVATKLAREYGVIVRDFGSKPLLKDCIRISVGTPEQNKLLLTALAKLL